MAGDWVSGKRTLVGSLLWFTVLQSVPVSQPTGHGNQLQLIYEKSPGRSDPDFRGKNCKAKCKTDHNWEQKSKAEIYVRSYREHFGLWNYDSLFFCLFTLVLSCLYFLCEWNYFGLDLPTPGYYCKRLPIWDSYAYRRHLLSLCRLL